MVILTSLVVLLSLSRITATTRGCGNDDDGNGDLAATIVLCCHLRVIDVSQYSVRYEYLLWAHPAKARR